MTNLTRSHFDDLNVGRLSLISAQDQVDGQREWHITYVEGNRKYVVSCEALPKYGIPHGVDNDVTAAIIEHFFSIGLPDDGLIEIGTTELLRAAGFHQNGKYYKMLKQSLERLASTTFTVSGGWRDHPNSRWSHAKFTYIQSLKWSARESGLFDERTIITFRLADDIVASLRSGYIKPLNIEFMQSLSRPRTRVVYRVLDAMRYDPEQPDQTRDVYENNLAAWAEVCKIPSTSLSNVRRALESPHAELIKKGYLRAVTYEGRGKQQRVRYEFHPEFEPVDPALLHRLRRHGVTLGVAQKLAKTYGKALLMQRIDQFERLVSANLLVVKKTPAAALVHLIKNPDQYVDVERTAKPVRKAAALPPAPRAEEERDEYQELFAGLKPAQAAPLFVKRLSLAYKRSFDATVLDALQHGVKMGELDPVEVLKAGYRALATMRGQEFVDEVKVAAQRWM